MKYKSIGLVIAALLAFASAAHADMKIGYVNADKVLSESPQAQAVAKKLKQEFSGREKDLLNGRKEIKKLEDKMARDSAIMSDVERSKLERDIMVRKRDWQHDADAFRDDTNLRQNDEMKKLVDMVRQIVQGIGKDQNYDLIVYDGVAYASPAVDLTDKVAEKLRSLGTAADAATAPKK